MWPSESTIVQMTTTKMLSGSSSEREEIYDNISNRNSPSYFENESLELVAERKNFEDLDVGDKHNIYEKANLLQGCSPIEPEFDVKNKSKMMHLTPEESTAPIPPNLSFDHISKKSSGITRRPMFSTKILEKPGVKKDYIKEMKTFLTPRELQEESNRKKEEKYTLEKYKTMVEIAVNELEKELKQHEKNPEKHPKYSEELEAFWSRRNKQLVLQGQHSNDHDYEPDWISFWMERMLKLHEKEVDKVKVDKAKKLGLTPDAMKSVEFKFEERSRSPSQTRSTLSLEHCNRTESPIKISGDSDDDDRQDLSRETSSSGYRRSEFVDLVGEQPVGIISLCKSLLALECELGIMNHRVEALLNESMRVEKDKPSSADDLLFEKENSIMLETVSHRFIGILDAQTLDPTRVALVKQAIHNIATLLHTVKKRMQTRFLEPFAVFGERKSSSSLDKAAIIEIASLLTSRIVDNVDKVKKGPKLCGFDNLPNYNLDLEHVQKSGLIYKCWTNNNRYYNFDL